MAWICIDQGGFRSSALAELVQDSSNHFVVCDAAIMEMCKSADRWEHTIRGSLALLAQIPERVHCAMSHGECVRLELNRGSALDLDDILSVQYTQWLRQFLLEIRDERIGPAFVGVSLNVDVANERVSKGLQNHSANLATLKSLIEQFKQTYTDDFLRRYRNMEIDDSDLCRSLNLATMQLLTSLSERGSTSTPNLASLYADRGFVARQVWLWAFLSLNWINARGIESLPAKKATNELVDNHYVLIGSYCNRILSHDNGLLVRDRFLRHALANWDNCADAARAFTYARESENFN